MNRCQKQIVAVQKRISCIDVRLAINIQQDDGLSICMSALTRDRNSLDCLHLLLMHLLD